MSLPAPGPRALRTLLTNISQVQHRGLYLHVSAIVIARDERLPERGHDRPLDRASIGRSSPVRQQVLLLGPSAAWPICVVDVPDVPHTLTEPPPPPGFPADQVPAQRTYDLQFEEGGEARASLAEKPGASTFEITTNLMDGQPIAVREFPLGTPISEVWGAIVPAVARAWDAPNFPVLAWHPREVVMNLHDRTL